MAVRIWQRIRPIHLVRLMLALIALRAIDPPHVLVVLDPPQQAITTNPLVGVHTRLTDKVEEWKIQRTLRMVREMGSPWIVEFFPWPYVEPVKEQYNWSHADAVIKHAENQGVTAIARLGWVPEWAHAVRPAQRIEYTIDAYEWARRHWPWCRCVAMWAFRYPSPTYNYQDYDEFVTTDFEPRVIYLLKKVCDLQEERLRRRFERDTMTHNSSLQVG